MTRPLESALGTETGATTRRVAGGRRLTRLAAGLALTALAFGSGTRPPESLVVERRDGHVRELKACGRQKACIRKPARAARRATGTTESVATPPAHMSYRRRWSEAQYDDVTVWIASGEAVPLWRKANRFMVRDAFHGWTAAGAPVHFVFVADSSRADVRVLWADSLPDGRAGQVTRLADQRGFLRAATIEMSTRNIGGRRQDSATVYAVALHEVGHLLGLEHSADEHDIMAAWVTAPSLTAQDRAAMRTLYDIADRR